MRVALGVGADPMRSCIVLYVLGGGRVQEKQCAGYGPPKRQTKTMCRIWGPKSQTKTMLRIWTLQKSTQHNVQDMAFLNKLKRQCSGYGLQTTQQQCSGYGL